MVVSFIAERLINGISHLKGVITRKVTNPKKAQDYETHIEKIVKSATSKSATNQ